VDLGAGGGHSVIAGDAVTDHSLASTASGATGVLT
jgi:hypothetical protein